MRALITGGLGFIGSNLARALSDAGAEVRILDFAHPSVHSPLAAGLPNGVRVFRDDIRDPAAVRRALEGGVDVVFHEAALAGPGAGIADAEEYIAINVLGTLHLLRGVAASARPDARVILASSMAVYGEGAYRCASCDGFRRAERRESDLRAGRWEPLCPDCGTALVALPTEEDHPPLPRTVYARSKLLQESLGRELGSELGVPTIALRYHNVYGPSMPRNTLYAGVASLFKSQVLAGRRPTVYEDGGQLRDFVHVDDVVRATLRAAEAPAGLVVGRAFNVGSGEPHSIGELAEAIASSHSPARPVELTGGFRPGDPRHVFGSVDLARRLLGYRAQVGFLEGMARFSRESMRAPVGAAPEVVP